MRKGSVAGRLGMAVVIIVAAMTACSGSGSGSEAAANVGCDSPGVTADEVKLGFVVTDSGTGSTSLSSARSGIDARIGLANEGGGIHGRRIIYDWRDDANSPSTNGSVIDELLGEPIFGLIAVTSALGGSVKTLAAQNVPVVGLTQPSFAQHQNIFSHLYEVAPETIGRYFQSSGGTKVAVLTTGSSAFTTETATRYATAIQSIGIPTVATIPFTRNTDSATRVAGQIAASGADLLLGIADPEDFAAVLKAVRDTNKHIAASILLSGYNRDTLSSLGSALVGVSFPVYFHPFESNNPSIKRYRDAMTRFAPQSAQPEQQFAMYAFIYADLFLQGLELAGECPTRDGFIKALRQVTDYNAGGLIESVDLRNNATTPLRCNAFVQISPAGDVFQIVQERLCADGQST